MEEWLRGEKRPSFPVLSKGVVMEGSQGLHLLFRVTEKGWWALNTSVARNNRWRGSASVKRALQQCRLVNCEYKIRKKGYTFNFGEGEKANTLPFCVAVPLFVLQNYVFMLLCCPG